MVSDSLTSILVKPLVIGALALACSAMLFVSVRSDLRSGEAIVGRWRQLVVTRRDNPTLFWISISIRAGVAAICVPLGLAFLFGLA